MCGCSGIFVVEVVVGDRVVVVVIEIVVAVVVVMVFVVVALVVLGQWGGAGVMQSLGWGSKKLTIN